MEYIILIVFIAGCLGLIWYLSRRPEDKSDKIDHDALRKAAEHGEVFAQYKLALMHHEGKNLPRDMDAAMQWYRRAADQGHVESQYTLGTLLDRGDGVARDKSAAYAWYTKAAMQGHEQAQVILSSEKWKDTEPAGEQAKPAKTPKASAQPLASHASTSTQEPDAMERLFQQAEDGEVDAQYNLGIMYYNGEGVPKDYTQALQWFLSAANQGDADAQFNLGLMIGKGEGVAKKDPKVSAQWFQRAAEQGHAEAREIVDKLSKK